MSEAQCLSLHIYYSLFYFPTNQLEFVILTLLQLKMATGLLFNGTVIYLAIKHVPWGKSRQPYLCRTVESGPSGCLQLAPLTGNHQGAAATSKQPRKAEVSYDDSRKTLTQYVQGEKKLTIFNFHFSYQILLPEYQK